MKKSTKNFLVMIPRFVVVLLLGACATPAKQADETPGKIEEATVTVQSGQAYFLFSDASIHPNSDGPATGLHVMGKMVDSKFVPDGKIVGDGELGQAGSPGWMELNDGSFHGAMTSRPPFPPYVEGFMQPDGTFLPGSRTVNY